jgi:hypothetical protein
VNDTDKILIYNKSILPSGYKHYPISEDQSDLGCPWIQMYRFPDGYSMEMDGLTFKRLSLTPVLELIYRDEEACSSQERTLISKLQTNLFLYVSK